jgi:hypothetical protein
MLYSFSALVILGSAALALRVRFNPSIRQWDEICCFHDLTLLADSARRDHWSFVVGYLCSLGEELDICTCDIEKRLLFRV